MPLLPTQPRPAPISPAPEPAGDEPRQAPLVVPAQAVLLPLQPAKLAAYKLFVEEVRFLACMLVSVACLA